MLGVSKGQQGADMKTVKTDSSLEDFCYKGK